TCKTRRICSIYGLRLCKIYWKASGPGAIHLLNGLYDAKADNTPVIAITGTTYSDLINSSYQQDVNLLQLYSDVAVYNDMIAVPEQAEMAVDIACRTALAQRGVSHLTIPIDVQERRLSGKYSRHNIAYHTSDVYVAETIPSHSLIEKAAQILDKVLGLHVLELYQRYAP
ncbi:MAG: thiamine pyrophosphate-binding protein, partial [Nitrososphaeraceae archaeon]